MFVFLLNISFGFWNFKIIFTEITKFRKNFRKKTFEIFELWFEKFRDNYFEIKKKNILKFQNFETINFEIIFGPKFRNLFYNFEILIRNSKISKF
jgi:hypothetical protein